MVHFSQQILQWFDQCGRKDLPWQQTPTPYRVWVSEIMLQQTQVKTVIPYFEKFMQVFPDIDSLANASADQVMQYWAGLGYYARARNLHKTAQIIVRQYQGKFPENLAELQALAGIGRSTAGAILSLSMFQYAAILDGNVKRVLARFFAIDGWTGKASVLKELWRVAEKLTPHERVNAYNQAMMDMGATVCTRSKPMCDECPLSSECQAYASGKPTQWPHSKPKKILPVKSTFMLILNNSEGELLLEKRPPMGIWGGLWSLPELNDLKDLSYWANHQQLTLKAEPVYWLERRHTFSHYHLQITPVFLQVDVNPTSVKDTDSLNWFTLGHLQQKGLAKPISDIINELQIGQCHEPNDPMQ